MKNAEPSHVYGIAPPPGFIVDSQNTQSFSMEVKRSLQVIQHFF